MRRSMSNLAQRILTAAVAIPVLLYLDYLAPIWAFNLFIIFIGAIAATEFYGIVGAKSRRMQVLGPILSMGIIAALCFLPNTFRVAATLFGLLPLVALISFLFNAEDLRSVPTRAGALVLGMLYTGFLLAFIPLIHQRPHGPHLVVLLLTIAFLGDTFAYTFGRIFGKHPLSKVSPKKTWEGAFGGLLGSASGALVASLWYLPELSLVPGLIVAVVLGALGQVGDLCESVLKRAFDVKDSGKLLPGHGGLLDRIDATLFVAAGLYIVLDWVPWLVRE